MIKKMDIPTRRSKRFRKKRRGELFILSFQVTRGEKKENTRLFFPSTKVGKKEFEKQQQNKTKSSQKKSVFVSLLLLSYMYNLYLFCFYVPVIDNTTKNKNKNTHPLF